MLANSRSSAHRRCARDNSRIGHSAYVGPRLNSTAAKCDEWAAANPGTEGAVAMAVLNEFVAQGWVANRAAPISTASRRLSPITIRKKSAAQTGVSADTIKRIAEWFGQADGAVALAGTDDPQAHLAAFILNSITGNVGRTMIFLDDAPAEAASRPDEVQALLDASMPGEVDVLVIAGGNPSYSMPPAYAFNAASRRVGFVVWMNDMRDETRRRRPSFDADASSAGELARFGAACGHLWPRPAGDAAGISEPSTARHSDRIGASRGARFQPVAHLRERRRRDQHLVAGSARQDRRQRYAKSISGTGASAGRCISGRQTGDVKLNAGALKAAPVPNAPAAGALVLWTYPHLFLYDGRGANKSWLQEIPDPVTQIVWDSWAEIHPDTAAQLGLKQDYESDPALCGHQRNRGIDAGGSD